MYVVTGLSSEEWDRLLAGLDSPSVGQVAEALSDACGVSVTTGYDVVEEELNRDDSALAEDNDDGVWVSIRACDENKDGGDR